MPSHVRMMIGLAAGLALGLAGVTPDQQAALRQSALADSGAVRHAAEQMPSGARFLVELIPANPVRAAIDGSLLPLIVATAALIRIVWWVLLLAPLGIFALVAGAVAQFGLSLVKTMAVFVVAVIAGLGVFIAGVLLPAIALLARMRVTRFLKVAWPSLAMAFSTTSSLATLPTMLAAAEEELKISRTVTSFVLPLGASLNRSGSALFQAVAIVFAARLYGVPLGAAELVQAGAAVFLASLTVAAVPSASVLSLAPAFSATGLPLAGLTLLIGLDRIPDMFRTMTNVAGSLSAATVVAALEGDSVSTAA